MLLESAGRPDVIAGDDYVGVDVHRAARVAALAHGGQIVVSPATFALLDGEAILDLGVHRLKDFDAGTRLYQIGGGDFPPLRAPGSVDLPIPATRFLGREHELFEAITLVYERSRPSLKMAEAGWPRTSGASTFVRRTASPRTSLRSDSTATDIASQRKAGNGATHGSRRDATAVRLRLPSPTRGASLSGFKAFLERPYLCYDHSLRRAVSRFR